MKENKSCLTNIIMEDEKDNKNDIKYFPKEDKKINLNKIIKKEGNNKEKMEKN